MADIHFTTTILGGLPVEVTANLQRGDRDIGEPARYAEVQNLYFATGRRYRALPSGVKNRMAQKDWDQLAEEALMAADARDGYYD